MAADWEWLDDSIVRLAHAEQLAEHGGGAGVRDANMLASALARPRNRAAYADADAAELAAAYAYGLARNHPFIDGNKRTAAVAAEAFLAINGYDMLASDVEVVVQITALAAGELDKEQLTTWYREHLSPHD
ncbi:MAG: type II toxin-antitoxin system death-on-curing family toxin [Pacificimonas sp.]